MSMIDYFRKAKEAKKKADEKKKRPDLGFLGKKGGNKAYEEAQDVLAEADEHED